MGRGSPYSLRGSPYAYGGSPDSSRGSFDASRGFPDACRGSSNASRGSSDYRLHEEGIFFLEESSSIILFPRGILEEFFPFPKALNTAGKQVDLE